MKYRISSHHRRAAASLAVLAVLALLLVGCSGQSDSGTDHTAAAGVGAKWGACMRDAGHDVQDPDDASVGAGAVAVPPGEDAEAFVEDSGSCAEAAGVKAEGSAELDKWTRQYAQVADCIRDNGYADFPEQEPGGIAWDDYPRAEEPGFEDVVGTCMKKYSPDTQTQNVG